MLSCCCVCCRCSCCSPSASNLGVQHQQLSMLLQDPLAAVWQRQHFMERHAASMRLHAEALLAAAAAVAVFKRTKLCISACRSSVAFTTRVTAVLPVLTTRVTSGTAADPLPQHLCLWRHQQQSGGTCCCRLTACEAVLLLLAAAARAQDLAAVGTNSS
ncbi:hypothetical protein COO60DRAFT_544432 [Scenedesmus sp. NREL 46B-D3]|nr:hypothetical protein COO60DRAFT_544432 [Scenedesmus sp. NREL 46B-D3]